MEIDLNERIKLTDLARENGLNIDWKTPEKVKNNKITEIKENNLSTAYITSLKI